jgi:hypothetical protein
VSRDESVDGRPALSECLRGARHVSAGRAQLLDEPLSLVKRATGPHCVDALATFGDHVLDERSADHGMRREHDRAADHILELAHVARPVTVREELHRPLREGDAFAADCSTDTRTQISRNHREVRSSFA